MADQPKMYRVTAPYVTVKTMTPDGVQIRGLHAGAPLPLDVSQDSVDHHLAMGLIEEIPQAEAKAQVKRQDDAEEAAAEARAAQQAEAQEAAKGSQPPGAAAEKVGGKADLKAATAAGTGSAAGSGSAAHRPAPKA